MLAVQVAIRLEFASLITRRCLIAIVHVDWFADPHWASLYYLLLKLGPDLRFLYSSPRTLPMCLAQGILQQCPLSSFWPRTHLFLCVANCIQGVSKCSQPIFFRPLSSINIFSMYIHFLYMIILLCPCGWVWLCLPYVRIFYVLQRLDILVYQAWL
jgi:hypothetical protein